MTAAVPGWLVWTGAKQCAYLEKCDSLGWKGAGVSMSIGDAGSSAELTRESLCARGVVSAALPCPAGTRLAGAEKTGGAGAWRLAAAVVKKLSEAKPFLVSPARTLPGLACAVGSTGVR